MIVWKWETAMSNSVIDWYEAHANELEVRYEHPSLTGLHDWFADIIPEQADSK